MITRVSRPYHHSRTNSAAPHKSVPTWAGLDIEGRRAELGFLPRVELAGNGRYPFCGAARGHVEVDAIPGIEASEVRPRRAR